MKRQGLLWLVGGLLVLGGLAGCAKRGNDDNDNDKDPAYDTTDSNEATLTVGAGGGAKSPGYASLGAIVALMGVGMFLRRRDES